MQHRMPDPGFYDPIFNLIDQGVAVPDFGRYLERSRIMTKEELMQRDMEGDVLILDPDRLRPNTGTLIDYNKMIGRKDSNEQIDPLQDRLALDLDFRQIDKRPINLVDMVECCDIEQDD